MECGITVRRGTHDSAVNALRNYHHPSLLAIRHHRPTMRRSSVTRGSGPPTATQGSTSGRWEDREKGGSVGKCLLWFHREERGEAGMQAEDGLA